MFDPRRFLNAAVGAVALLQSTVQSAPVQTNAVTPVGDIVLMSPSHPAYGAEIAMENRIRPEVPIVTIEDLVFETMSLNGGIVDAGRVSTGTGNETAIPDIPVNTTARRTNEVRERVAKTDLERLEAYFKKSLERNVNKLATKGAAASTPWPGSYWPVFEDGINKQWVANQPDPVIQKREMKPDAAASEFFRTNKYPFNPVIQKILYVKNRFTWMLEAFEDGPLVSTRRADKFVQVKDYEYVLELDKSGNILGGEWVGASKEDHPDFLWFPTAKPPSNSVSRVGISYQQVSDLLKASINANC